MFILQRLIDKTKVTCLKWLPGSTNLFLASHASGHLYLYNEELPCTPTAPSYQPFKICDGYSILTCKSKSTRNPLYKWTFGPDTTSINEFCFSPCGSNLAIVSQDGFLRVFHYDTMEIVGLARSYFGGFLCVCWSPDGKYIVVGGEDDLVTVWSLSDKRVVARGQGHRSWVSVVAFDPYTTSYSKWDGPDFSDDENSMNMSDNNYRFSNNDESGGDSFSSSRRQTNNTSIKDTLGSEKLPTSYRLGSVSQDTQLCLWDITEDVLRQSINFRHRLSSHDPQNSNNDLNIKSIKPVLMTKDELNKQSSNKITSINSSSSNSDNIFIGSGVSGTRSGSFINDKVVGSGGAMSTSSNSSEHNKNTSENNKNVIVGNNNKSNSRKSNPDNQIGNCTVTTNANKSVENSNIDSASNTITKSSTSSKSSESSISSVGGVSGSGNSNTRETSGISAFNTFTQKFSNFSFGSDKKNSTSMHDSSTLSATHNQNHHHNNYNKKNFILPSKSSSNNYNLNNHNNNSSTLDSSNSLDKNSKNVLTTYDPMRLIGTASCPRYDECPVLEPLVCKKIAHERLTALIFREDCFLTACQDGFIYTWARPGSVST